MRKTLVTLLILVALALCVVSIVQWRREAQFRARIDEVSAQLLTENEARVAAEDRASAYEKEIARLTQLRADTEAKLIEVTDELTLTQTDQLQRGVAIAAISGEWSRAQAEVEAAREVLAQNAAAATERNTAVAGQNEAIAEANKRIQQLVAERDAAIQRLNEQTKAFNTLVEKYNKLAR